MFREMALTKIFNVITAEPRSSCGLEDGDEEFCGRSLEKILTVGHANLACVEAFCRAAFMHVRSKTLLSLGPEHKTV